MSDEMANRGAGSRTRARRRAKRAQVLGRRPRKPCSFPGCGRHAIARGLCQTHYRQLRELGTLQPLRPYRWREGKTEKVAGFLLTELCADAVRELASERGWSLSAALSEILERWSRSEERRRSKRRRRKR